MVIRNILFIELMGGIGDLVIALPAIRGLALSNPGAKVAVLTFYPGGTLLEDTPYVAEVVYATSEKSRPGEGCPQRKDVERILSRRSFDVVVSDTMYGGIDRVVEHSAARYKVSNLWRHPPANELVGDRFVRILRSEGLIDERYFEAKPSLVVSEPNRVWAHHWRRNNLLADGPFAILNPEAGMPIKRWAPPNFVAVGKWLASERGLGIVVLASEDVPTALFIADEIGPSAVVLPRVHLSRLAAIAAQATLFVSSDTGPARIASALGASTIALYGPSFAGRYGLKAPGAAQAWAPGVVNLQSPRVCAERNPQDFTLQSCWYSGICVHADSASCVDEISAESVIRSAQLLLGADGPQ